MVRAPAMAQHRSYGTIIEPLLSRNDTNEGRASQIHHSANCNPLDDELKRRAHNPQLRRSRSTWEVAFMSFVLASVPFGLSTTLLYPLTGGGPVTVIWGWVLVCCLMLCVAISLGEITSVYPVAGGVYYQTYMLSPVRIRCLMAWLAGWSFFLGNVIITLSINFGTTLFLIGCINVFRDDAGVGVFPAEPHQIYLIFLGITLLCNTISATANKWLPFLDIAAVITTFLGVIAILVCTLTIANEGRHSASYVFTAFEPSSGWEPNGLAFCVGLLHAAYATSATGMIVSMCDEVQHPATQVPRAMVLTVVLNAACGLLFLVPLVIVMPGITTILADPTGQPLPVILRSAIGSLLGVFALCIPIILLGIMCGISCTTAASRCAWAFARDGAIPGSSRWGWDQISARLNVPLNAMMLSMVLQLGGGLLFLGSRAAFNAFIGAGVIFLTLSYVMPIAVSFGTGRRALARGAYDLGWFGVGCNVVSIGWCVLAIPLFCMPAALPVTPDTMNYASVVFVGGLLISVLWYVARGRKTYHGPRMMGSWEG